MLATEVGPRRPTGAAERQAAERMRDELAAHGLDARLEAFAGYSSFAWPLGAVALAGILPALLPRRRRFLRGILSTASLAALAVEGPGGPRPLGRRLQRAPSQNLVATVEPRSEPRRTVCLVGHLDTSRSGLMFHPRVSAHINAGMTGQAVACIAQAAEPLIQGSRTGRRAVGAARLLLAAGLALLAERELRGQDVPGANDNASGSAVAAQLAVECAADPPEATRVVLLLTGCEESGLLGAEAFLETHDTRDWLFLNFDTVGGPARLRFAKREGIGGRLWPADEALVRIASNVARDRPDLDLSAAERPIGLTYDTTPVLAGGGRAVTFIAGNGGLPNYHWPTDTAENIDPATVGRALEAGREMLAAITRGEADRAQTWS